jgi:uncharacterized protein (DUF1015 family)
VGSDISHYVAPPYDVIDQQRKDELRGRSEHNIVNIDLPFVPPSKAGPPEVYEDANVVLQQWLADGILTRDEQPMLYRYDQVFMDSGCRYTRRKFFAAMRLSDFAQGDVLPHERTFGGPKEDRLHLMQSTRCNLSPVFGLYSDLEGKVLDALAAAASSPTATAVLEDVNNRIWPVADGSIVKEVQELLRDKAVYIADGHHRYGTALMYRKWLADQQGPLPEDHPANFVMVVLCAMEDEGLLIRATHRIVENVPGFDVDRLVDDSGGCFNLIETPDANWKSIICDLQSLPAGSFGVVHPGSGRAVLLVLESESVLDKLEAGRSEAWRRFGISILHRFVIDELIAKQVKRSPSLGYDSSPREAVGRAARTDGLALLVQPTRMDRLRAICRAGDLMPQKSTYFFPKLVTGLVINPLG